MTIFSHTEKDAAGLQFKVWEQVTESKLLIKSSDFRPKTVFSCVSALCDTVWHQRPSICLPVICMSGWGTWWWDCNTNRIKSNSNAKLIHSARAILTTPLQVQPSPQNFEEKSPVSMKNTCRWLHFRSQDVNVLSFSRKVEIRSCKSSQQSSFSRNQQLKTC